MKNMYRLITIVAALIISAATLSAQETAKEFLDRYNLIVSKLGPSGVGLETLLDRWAEAYPDDTDMLLGKFSYYFSKSQSTSVVPKESSKFLGEKPVLALKDSTGADVNYFQETFYDDELFGEAEKALDKAIQLNPDRLDMRFLKAASLIGYEKESPDMALSSLKSLIDYNATVHPAWVYPGEDKVDDEFFYAAIQEYCFLFFRYGTDQSFQAFKDLSQKVLDYNPDNVLFLDNMGSYYLVAAHDDKMAMKYYTRVLKLKKDDLTAIRNIIILARNAKNEKLEKKYLPLMVKYADDEATRLSAQARLDYFNAKK